MPAVDRKFAECAAHCFDPGRHIIYAFQQIKMQYGIVVYILAAGKSAEHRFGEFLVAAQKVLCAGIKAGWRTQADQNFEILFHSAFLKP